MEEIEREAAGDILTNYLAKGETEAIIKWLEENPKYCDILIHSYESTPFLKACYHNNEQLIEYLDKKNVNIHFQDKYSRNAIYFAVLNNNAELIQRLYKKGIDIDMPDLDKDTPLIRAAYYNFNKCIKELIKCGADVNKKNNEQEDFLYYVETKECNIETAYLMEHLHLFHESNQKRIKKIRLKRVVQGGN